MSDYILNGMAIIFAILTIILWSGKGSFLIAGYNTASKRDKAKYDAKKLGRVTGSGLGFLAIALFLMNEFGEEHPLLGTLLFIFMMLAIAVMLVLAHTYAKVENPPQVTMTKEDHRKHSRNNIIALVLGLVACFIVVLLLFRGEISYEFKDDYLRVKSGSLVNKKIDLQGIKEITLESDIDRGDRVGGKGNLKVSAGNYKNEAFGKYYLFVYNKNDEYIVMKDDENVYVLNQETKEETKELFERLQQIK
ncbi:MAG TPA: DUF3784 domain-containing protein [Candidatus Dorea intestinavium]|nr:DUF3784 domain-containing protein [Candidatus Dorea intestinavium]